MPTVKIASAATVGIVSLAVYVRTLMPGMAFGDWGEMQTVPHILGIAHPTGYPTYILLAWLAQLAPVGSIAFRANLLSALLVSGAVVVTVLILLRLGIRPVIAVACALVLGAVGTVWSVATVSEVNPLHLLFVAVLIHRALVWESERRPRDLLLGAFLVGLAFGNHLLTLFVAPFIAIFVLWVGRREIAARPWLIGAAAVATVLGLVPYLYIPLAAAASPALGYNHPVTFDSFVFLVTGAQFRQQFQFLTPGGPAELVSSLPGLWSTAMSRATVVLPIVGLAGVPILVRQRPAFGLTCIAIMLTTTYVWANYLHLEHYLLAPWLVLTISAAVAVEALARRLDRRRRPTWAGGRFVGAAAAVFAVGLTVTNWAAADRSGDQSARTYVDALFDALPHNAAVLSIWDTSTPLWHARLILGERPDVLVVDDTDIVYGGWGTRERRIASLICERPVFILRLRDVDLVPTIAAYPLRPFIDVEVAFGGPSAVVTRTVYRVEPPPTACV
jgi:hypothetical protein